MNCHAEVWIQIQTLTSASPPKYPKLRECHILYSQDEDDAWKPHKDVISTATGHGHLKLDIEMRQPLHRVIYDHYEWTMPRHINSEIRNMGYI